LAYARELVRRSTNGSRLQQRMSWWAALALLRCVSSSPAAASASLRTKLLALQRTGNGQDNGDDQGDERQQAADLEELAGQAVLDGDSDDLTPEEAAPGSDLALPEDQDRLADLIAQADLLRGPSHDPKFKKLVSELKALLAEGFRPVIFCRFRPTAHYVAEQLILALPKKGYAIEAITGELPPEERILRIAALEDQLGAGLRPILVATDCLSEGIDLQRSFDAVVHYDLCWNPTRHEQREGRVDRFGQARTSVRALMIHGGSSNPVDERVRTVILEKERTIRKELGVSVPIPGNASTITQAVLSSLLGPTAQEKQLDFDLGLEGSGEKQLDWQDALEREWQSAKDKARRTQTIFAQRRLKPEEALQEWKRSTESLGSHGAVERLVITSCRRLDLPVGELGHDQNRSWELDLAALPDNRIGLRERLESHDLGGKLRLCFSPPYRDGARLITRSHPLVVELADFVAERALSGLEPELAARSSVVRTKAVDSRTELLLVRLRHQLRQERWNGRNYDDLPPLLVEECLTLKVNGTDVEVLGGEQALALLGAPASGNVVEGQRQQWLRDAVADLPRLRPALDGMAEQRAVRAEEDHRRVRQASLGAGESLRMRFRCEPTLPVDVIGLFLLLPAPQL